jgi:hypothetical protein
MLNQFHNIDTEKEIIYEQVFKSVYLFYTSDTLGNKTQYFSRMSLRLFLIDSFMQTKNYVQGQTEKGNSRLRHD